MLLFRQAISTLRLYSNDDSVSNVASFALQAVREDYAPEDRREMEAEQNFDDFDSDEWGNSEAEGEEEPDEEYAGPEEEDEDFGDDVPSRDEL